MRNHQAFALMVILGSLIGCERESEEPALTPASYYVSTSPAAEDAIEAVTSTRCDRESRCNRVGADLRYASREHCMNVLRRDAAEELVNCRQGVDQKDLSECLNAIDREGCSSPLDHLERLVACKTDNLCTE